MPSAENLVTQLKFNKRPSMEAVLLSLLANRFLLLDSFYRYSPWGIGFDQLEPIFIILKMCYILYVEILNCFIIAKPNQGISMT